MYKFSLTRTIIHDLVQGIYSKIPLCCILNFLYLDWKRVYCGTFMRKKLCNSKSDIKKYHKFEYVPCKKCFETDNIKKLKSGEVKFPNWWFPLDNKLK